MGEDDLSAIAQSKNCDRPNSSSHRKNAIALSLENSVKGHDRLLYPEAKQSDLAL
jgi:hypothetical protein